MKMAIEEENVNKTKLTEIKQWKKLKTLADPKDETEGFYIPSMISASSEVGYVMKFQILKIH